MVISKFNAEGYHDPTAFDALTKVERESSWLPLVYICSPYAGNVEKNVDVARKYCRFALNQKCIPLAPHLLYPQFMDDSDQMEHNLAMRINAVLVGQCEELWVFGRYISAGMANEINKAKKYKKKVRYFSEEMKENA